MLRRQELMAVIPPYPKHIPKPYEQLRNPEERIQTDVKFVPAACLVGQAVSEKIFQYTALDEYSRWRYVEAFEPHESFASTQFLEHLAKRFPLPIDCIQTNNGGEFTKRFVSKDWQQNPTLFEQRLKELSISHKLICP